MKKFILASLISLAFVACDDENDGEPIKPQQEANEISTDAIAANSDFETAFSGIENVVADVANKESDSATYTNGNCATISVTPDWASNTFPKTITVDFGDTNCLGIDGNYRRGKIIIELSGKYRDTNTVITSRLENYYHNDNKIEGSKTKKNLSRNTNNNLVYSVEVRNGRMEHVNGYTLSWESDRTNEWIAGENTVVNFFDDAYSITGTASGKTQNDKSYTLTITNPLQVQLDCRWIKAGTISIKPEDFEARTVDYGNGACDRLATYTVGGKSYQFSMR
jgi:hypothetical protein